MKKIIFTALLLLMAVAHLACETPDATIQEATQDLQKGISGQGHLEERNWEDVEVYQN